MILHFFTVRLKEVDGRRAYDIRLRFRAGDDSIDFSASEPVLASFCFPLGPDSVSPKEFMASEEFTFTLTHGDGRRFQGFCRKHLPPPPKTGSRLRLPQVICIISEHSWCPFFFKALQSIEQILRPSSSPTTKPPATLPAGSDVELFLTALASELSKDPLPGQTVLVPLKSSSALNGSSPMPRASSSSAENQLELQVPPDCGNGRSNCGIPLARLLWHLPVSSVLTLIASMMLERRIVIVGQSRDTVTATVQAASALIYPFAWHHIYLPLLPMTLKDYLTAPMPFLVGLPAQMLPSLKQMAIDEATIVDLDLGRCEPGPGSPRDDSRHLPWREKLETALTYAKSILKSPTEFESSPLIAGIMQEYLLRLFGSYRRFVQLDSPSTTPNMAVGGKASMDGVRGKRMGGGGDDHALMGFGHMFDQAAFLASHRSSDKARNFLSLFRQSQMYEVFIQERLKMALMDYETDDAFESRLVHYNMAIALRGGAGARRAYGLSPHSLSGSTATISGIGASMGKRQSSSSDQLNSLGNVPHQQQQQQQIAGTSFVLNSSSSNLQSPSRPPPPSPSSHAQPQQQFTSALLRKKHQRSNSDQISALTDQLGSPHQPEIPLSPIRGSASSALSMRRITTDPSSHLSFAANPSFGGLSVAAGGGGGALDPVLVDPSSFFDEIDRLSAGAAAAGGGGGRPGLMHSIAENILDASVLSPRALRLRAQGESVLDSSSPPLSPAGMRSSHSEAGPSSLFPSHQQQQHHQQQQQQYQQPQPQHPPQSSRFKVQEGERAEERSLARSSTPSVMTSGASSSASPQRPPGLPLAPHPPPPQVDIAIIQPTMRPSSSMSRVEKVGGAVLASAKNAGSSVTSAVKNIWGEVSSVQNIWKGSGTKGQPGKDGEMDMGEREGRGGDMEVERGQSHSFSAAPSSSSGGNRGRSGFNGRASSSGGANETVESEGRLRNSGGGGGGGGGFLSRLKANAQQGLTLIGGLQPSAATHSGAAPAAGSITTAAGGQLKVESSPTGAASLESQSSGPWTSLLHRLNSNKLAQQQQQ